MNRLKGYFDNPQPPEPANDYFELYGGYVHFTVSRETALEIERWLNQLPPPMWIVFQDLTGSRHRILATRINRISESTAAQRAAGRAFERARELEEKQDRRSWDDE